MELTFSRLRKALYSTCLPTQLIRIFGSEVFKADVQLVFIILVNVADIYLRASDFHIMDYGLVWKCQSLTLELFLKDHSTKASSQTSTTEPTQ